MKRNILKLLIMLCLALLLPAMALATGGTWGGTWGGIDWTFEETDTGTGYGKLTIEPTKGTPTIYPRTGQPYPVGVWPEGVIWSGSSASNVGGLPYNPKKVIDLEIKEGVTSIGSFVAEKMPFSGELVIPSTVTYIGQQAFQSSNVTKVTFAAGSQLKCIAASALKNLKIKELILPEGLECIHVWAFGGNTQLEYAYIPSTVTDFNDHKHNDYSPKGVSYKDQSSIFNGCSKLAVIECGSEAVRDLFLSDSYLYAEKGQIDMPAYSGKNIYTSVEAALDAAAETGGTVTLSKQGMFNAAANIVSAGSEAVIPPNVTLEIPAGKTLTIAGTLINTGAITGGGTINITGAYGTNDQASESATINNTGTEFKIWGIGYNLNDGQVAGSNPYYYREGNAAMTLLNPTRNGYTFKGWSGTGLKGDKNQTVTIPANSAKNFIFTANWTPIKVVSTGDEAQLALWFGLCLAGCAGMLLLRKPRRQMK